MFASRSTIAATAGVSVESVKKHIAKLLALNLIEKLEQRGSRRTVSYQLNLSLFDPDEDYGLLPIWALELLKSFSERAVFGSIYYRYYEGNSNDKREKYFRLECSLSELREFTGLCKEAVSDARYELERLGLIVVDRGERIDGRGFHRRSDQLSMNVEYVAGFEATKQEPLSEDRQERQEQERQEPLSVAKPFAGLAASCSVNGLA